MQEQRPWGVMDPASGPGLHFQPAVHGSSTFMEKLNAMMWADPHSLNQHTKPGEVEFFRMEDLWAWIGFTILFFVLVLFDNLVLHRKAEKISFGLACLYTVFWIG